MIVLNYRICVMLTCELPSKLAIRQDSVVSQLLVFYLYLDYFSFEAFTLSVCQKIFSLRDLELSKQ